MASTSPAIDCCDLLYSVAKYCAFFEGVLARIFSVEHCRVSMTFKLTKRYVGNLVALKLTKRFVTRHYYSIKKVS